MLKLAIQRYFRWFAVIVALMIVATVVSFYILIHERLPVPWQSTYVLKAEFVTAYSAAGGEGLPVTVAGVQVGTIRSVVPKDGRALVTMAIDPSTLRHVYANATANLEPNTPLDDMEVRIAPGGPPARPLPPGGMIPLGNTLSPVGLDELLSALDSDSRLYLTSLLGGLDQGTQGRGLDVRQLLKALGPTTVQLRELGDALVGRRDELARVVHNLGLLTAAAGAKDTEITQVVTAGDRTLSALAGQDTALRDSLTLLPGTLADARTTLSDLTPLANLLGPTLTALQPTVRRLPGALAALGPLAATATPIVRDQIRPLVRRAEPLAVNLAPAVADLSAQSPDLTQAFRVLEYVANEDGYHNASWPGVLYWLAWISHNADSLLSTDDAHGAIVRAMVIAGCKMFTSQPVVGTLISSLLHNPLC